MPADEARVALSATGWRSMFVSHRGAVRTTNEDSFLEAPDLGLWVIADGMGGHEGGQMASAMIVHALEQVPQLSSGECTDACVRERVAPPTTACRSCRAKRSAAGPSAAPSRC